MTVLTELERRVYNWIAPTKLAFWTLVITAELLALGIYFAAGAQVTTVRYVVYPLVWINVGLWIALNVRPRAANRRVKLLAGGVGVGYFLVLTWFAGLYGFATSDSSMGLSVTMASPGFGPIVGYFGATIYVLAVPYLLVGYLALAYLVYDAALDATRAALPGVLGLASCVGCAFPIVATILAGVAGGSSGLVTTVYAHSMDISTLAFIFAVAVLYWRPGMN